MGLLSIRRPFGAHQTPLRIVQNSTATAWLGLWTGLRSLRITQAKSFVYLKIALCERAERVDAMFCTKCGGPLPEGFRQGQPVTSHVVCPRREVYIIAIQGSHGADLTTGDCL